MKRGVFLFWSLFIGCAVVRVIFSLHQDVTDIGLCNKQLISGVGTVIQDPSRTEAGQVLVVQAHKLFTATTTAGIITAETGSPCTSEILIRMKTKSYPRFVFDDEVSFSGKISKPFNFKSGTGRAFDYIGYLAKDDVFYEIKSAKVESQKTNSSNSQKQGTGLGDKISGILFYLKRRFVSNLEQTLGEPHAALAAGLVVGEKSALGKDLLNDFRIVGLIHIVVLSGFNITIVGDAMRRLLSFLPRVWGISIGGLGIGLFGVMVGGGATVVRSCFMAGIALSADLIRRDYNVTRALIFAGLVMLIQSPMILLHDPSFQLSFLATLGLILLASPIEKHLTRLPEKFGIRGIVASTIATQIFVSPYILYMMGTMSIIGIVVNILVLPIIPVTMLMVFLTGASGFISMLVAHVFGWIAHLLLTYELHMVEWFARIPFASVTLPQFSGWWVVGFYVVFGMVYWGRGLFKKTTQVLFKEKKEGKISSLNPSEIFREFQKIPKGVLIDRPDELIQTNYIISNFVQDLLPDKIKGTFFTKRSLKHITEKGDKSMKLFDLIPEILKQPDLVLRGKEKNRRVSIVRFFPNDEGEPQIVVVEHVGGSLIIVTTFKANKKYLKNFEILWRTDTSYKYEAVPPSAYLP